MFAFDRLVLNAENTIESYYILFSLYKIIRTFVDCNYTHILIYIA